MGKWKIGIKDIGIHVAGFFVARAAIFAMNPLAVGFFAAAYIEKKYRLSLFAIMALGMAMAMPAGQAVKYALIMAAAGGLASFVEKKTGKPSVLAAGAAAAAVTAVFSLFSVLAENAPDRMGQMLLVLMEALLVLAAANLFYLSIRYFLDGNRGQALSNEELISIAILLAVAVYGMPRPQMEGIFLVETAAYLLVLFMGYKYGAGAGAISGACLGLVLSLGSQNALMLGVFCILGVCSGMFREIGRIPTALSFLVVSAFLGFFYAGTLLERLQIRGILSAVVIFILLPGSYLYRVSAGTGEGVREAGLSDEKAVTKWRLSEFADSFRRLSRTFAEAAQVKSNLENKDINDIFDILGERLCSRCEKRNYCVNRDKFGSYQNASVLEAARCRGSIGAEDLPDGFAGRCVNLEAFLDETNRELTVAALNLNLQNRMAESREAVAGQFGEVAEMIKDITGSLCDKKEVDTAVGQTIARALRMNHIDVKNIAVMENRYKKKEIHMTLRTGRGRCITTKEAAQLVGKIYGRNMRPAGGTKNIISRGYDSMLLVEDTDFKILTGMAKRNKEGETVCGDSFSFLQLENGKTVMMLSDGMGSGPAAYAQSGTVIELLEEFMEAGFSEKSAIHLINSILVLKSGEQSFSTLDLGIINMYTGICSFIKIGASATFIKRNGSVEIIRSESLPVGVFNQLEFEEITKKLYDGDLIVMVSDGIMDYIDSRTPEHYMEKLLMGMTCKKPQEIANLILENILEQNTGEAKDDMSVLTAGFWKK